MKLFFNIIYITKNKMDVNHTIYKNGDQVWKSNGQLHREDGPAVIYADGGQEWWVHGKKHRLDGPAVIYVDILQAWWNDGRLHRNEGPAIIYANGDQSWYINGRLHRTDGPAILSYNYVIYCTNGVRIKKERYYAQIHDKFRFKSGCKTKAASREYLQ